MTAFHNAQNRRIKHVTAIKPLLKPEDRRQRVFAEAARIASTQASASASMAVPDIIRALALAADPPKRSGSPKKSGLDEVISSSENKPLLRIEAKDRKSTRLNSSH